MIFKCIVLFMSKFISFHSLIFYPGYPSYLYGHHQEHTCCGFVNRSLLFVFFSWIQLIFTQVSSGGFVAHFVRLHSLNLFFLRFFTLIQISLAGTSLLWLTPSIFTLYLLFIYFPPRDV